MSALVVGCDPPPVPDDADCSDGECVALYQCVAPLGLPEDKPVVLCDCTDVTSLGLEGFRTTCHKEQADADDFCHAECIKAALQNGHTQAEAEASCEWAQAMPVLDEFSGYQSCFYDRTDINKPLDYSPQVFCPSADGTEDCGDMGPGGIPFIYCHGTAEPTDPGSLLYPRFQRAEGLVLAGDVGDRRVALHGHRATPTRSRGASRATDPSWCRARSSSPRG